MTSKTDAHKALFRTLGDFVQRLVDEHFKVGSLAAVCRWLVASALVLGVTACASVPPRNSDSSQVPVAVPGTGLYCLREIPAKEFTQTLQESYAVYGPFKRGRLGGDSSICDLNRFYTYSVHWVTKEGRQETFNFDIEQLMRKFQAETPDIYNHVDRQYGSIQIRVTFALSQIKVSYVVSEYNRKGSTSAETVWNGINHYEYPILSIPLQHSPALKISD